MNSRKNRSGMPSRQLWIIPVIILLIVAVTGGGYFAFSQLQAMTANSRSTLPNQSSQSGQPSTTGKQTAAATTETLSAAVLEKKQALERDTFYEGIYVNELPLAGLTREAAATLIAAEEKKIRDTFKVEVAAGQQKLTMTPDQAGLAFDTQSILATAFETGRKSGAASESARINERYAVIEGLKQKPLKLTITAKANPEKASQAIIDWAAALSVPAKDAKAVGFDFSSHSFKFEAEKPGYRIDAAVAASEASARLASGTFQYTGSAKTEPVAPKLTVASMQGKLGLISTAETFAGSESSRARDTNISKVVSRLNGMIIQPGATFSFNGTFGQRTAEKGFAEAGGIRDGILVQELGGGICQPNTTLYQAVLKADLQIVSRSPHSWPSAYTQVGLDATVSWPGPDFKFTNNTNYPIAIVASFNKPRVVFSVYGRQLEPGVSISLTMEHNGYVKEEPPIEKLVSTLPAGTRNEIRKPRTGQKATSYKIWKKDGVVIKKELVAVSTYKPIQGLYEYGPPKPSNPTTTPTTGTTTSTTKGSTTTTPTSATTSATTTNATTTATTTTNPAA